MWVAFWFFLAQLNFVLGAINLVPLLPFDGGHIAVAVYEKIRNLIRSARGVIPAGPVDYTPGAMLNATKADFKPVFNRPMSQGTRCQQLAMYVVFESPLQMLADSPSNYRKEPESLAFLSAVPTVWDETVVLSAKVGEYIVTARRSGKEWYVGAITNWTARDLEIDLSWLGRGPFMADIYRDGPNADRAGVDYAREQRPVTAADRLKLSLAPGGGFVARFVPR